MRVLITNVVLWPRTGTALYVRDVALGLRRRGHEVAVFAPRWGDIATELRAAGVAVVDRVARLPWRPDVIHGHHHLPLLRTLHAWPGVPAVQICHDSRSPHDEAVDHRAVRKHFAVSGLCRDRRLREGLAADRLSLLPNFVDLTRFKPRGPLPAEPRRALVFSNYATDDTYLAALRRACEARGIAVDVVGLGVGAPASSPETLLPEYDVVFGKARSALEAMASGCAVVLCDVGGLGPLVRSVEVHALQAFNFGQQTLTDAFTPAALLERLDAYDADDAAQVRDWVRTHASLDVVLDRLEASYRSVIAAGVPAADGDAVADVMSVRVALRLAWWWLAVPAGVRARLRWLSGRLRFGARGRLLRSDPLV